MNSYHLNRPIRSSIFYRVIVLSLLLSLLVIGLGAYTRLSDAGLGCPDWPGCYGHLSVPEKISSNSEFQRPLETNKAWKEMIHRYVAGTLGLLILSIFIMALKGLPKRKQSIFIPGLLLVSVIFQALLGMWTVTLKLSPVVVSAHLLGGFTTLSLIWWLLLNQRHKYPVRYYSVSLKFLSLIALSLLVFQIFLGGWTSSNYAALACGTDFPRCAGQWLPPMDFKNGFDIKHQAGTNYEFGILESSARTAIQFIHRSGALIIFLYLSFLSFILIRKKQNLSTLGKVLLSILLLQVSLGIMNVAFALPLLIAVLHNFVATLLLLTVIYTNHRIFKGY